ncbi:MAG: hypothetical protein ACYC09_13005 [Bacteroidota bacterium]
MLNPEVLDGGLYDTDELSEVSAEEFARAVMEWKEVIQFYRHRYENVFTISVNEYYELPEALIDGWSIFLNMINAHNKKTM